MGTIAHSVATALKASWENDLATTSDTLALLLVCLDHAMLDQGSLLFSKNLLLLPEPPPAMFRREVGSDSLRQYSALADHTWITSLISYCEGMDSITARRLALIKRDPNRPPKWNERTPKGPKDPKGPKGHYAVWCDDLVQLPCVSTAGAMCDACDAPHGCQALW